MAWALPVCGTVSPHVFDSRFLLELSRLKPEQSDVAGRGGELGGIRSIPQTLALALGCWLTSVATAGELDVVISEIHYNVFRAGAEATLEFVELENRGATRVDLGGWSFAEGISYSFPIGSMLAPGGIAVVSPSPAVARATYRLEEVYGPYSGSLDNRGEVIALANRHGHVVDRVHYGDADAWPSRPDGRGPSLEFTGRAKRNGPGRYWKPSVFLNGTPGARNSRRLVGDDVVPAASPYIGGIINEVLPTADGANGFVEFYNPTDSSLDLSGFILLASGFEFIFELPDGTVLAAGERASFSGGSMDTPIPVPDQRYVLLANDGRTVIDDLAVTPRAGRSFGRFPDGDRDAHVLDTPTPGDANEYTEERNVVINEIQYHPPFVEPSGECPRNCSDANQWIELHNPTASSIDLDGWRLSSAVRYEFTGVTIGAGDYLVVAADAAVFSAMHPGVAGVVGDWSGRLSHSSETIVLRNELGNPVDRVEYGDGGPENDEDPVNGVDDETFAGSFWPGEPDGSGSTLELIHPSLSNRAAVAWRASTDEGGTPGARNSRFDPTPPPTIRDVEHSPLVPMADEPVTVTCRVSSALPLSNAVVDWAVDGGGASGEAELVDDGTNGDRIAGDGEFTATIPGRAEGTIVRFAVIAEDASGETRVPLEPRVRPYNSYPGTFYLYEVDNDAGPSSGAPVYRLIMSSSDRERLRSRDEESNVLLPATFIAENRAYHLTGIRYRGESSRRDDNKSFKLRFRPEDSFDGRDNINLNGGNGGSFGDSAFREILSADFLRRAGLPTPQMWPIALHFRGGVDDDFDSRYAFKEAYDEEFLERQFGGSGDGNLYRARNPESGLSGNLSFRGEDPDDYRTIYEKNSNGEADDYSDIIELCRTFDPDETPDESFPERVNALVDARQWARFFVALACLSNTDGGIWNSNGEDYFLYHVPADSSRPDAGKWILLPWDIEETFQRAEERLFRSTVDSIERFFSVEAHARLYYDELERARAGAFSRLQMRQEFSHADAMFDPEDVFNVVDVVDTNITQRLGFIDSAVSWKVRAGAFGTDLLPGDLVIAAGDTWRYFKGTEQPPGGDTAWTQRTYDDGDWLEGPSGFGYGDGDDATVLDDMQGNYSTVFARARFQVADANLVVSMTLAVDYDDAYVAYLNGTEIARSNTAPNNETITYDMDADSDHEASDGGPSANPVEIRNVSHGIALLRSGTNVLAIVGLNGGSGSSDFSLIPELSLASGAEGGGPAGGCGPELYAAGATVRIDGVANAATTRSVAVDGITRDVSVIEGGNGPWGATWSMEVVVPQGASTITIEAFSGLSGTGSVVERTDLLVHRDAQGFTDVEGSITGNETWTAAESPYRMVDDVTIASGGSLTIEPGTVVLAALEASLIVRGELTALGTEGNPIRFLAYECGGNWGGIAFDATGRGGGDPLHELRYLILRDGSTPDGFAGCVAATDAKLLVAHCEISDIPNNAIDTTSAELEVRDTHIHDIFEGVHCSRSTAVLRDCVIENMMGNSDAVDFDGSGEDRSVIERCIFVNSSDDGIDLGGVTVDIRDNILVGIEDKAISIEGPGSQGQPTLTGNLIYASGSGMAIKNGIEISEGWHNTVANCQEGVQLFAKDRNPNGGHGTFHSMIVWDNVVDVFVDDRSSVDFEFSNIGGEGLWPGPGNIHEDPQFAGSPSGDYSLLADSPCRGTGRDGEDMGVIGPRIVDPKLFVRGDTNRSGIVDISDAIESLNFLFRGAPGPLTCLDIVDANDDGAMDISDAIFTLRFLFAGGPPIPAPYPNAGTDPTPDGIPCAE